MRPVDETLLMSYHRRWQRTVERFHRLLAAMDPMSEKSKTLTPAQKEALLKEMAALERIANICAILRESEEVLDGMLEASAEASKPAVVPMSEFTANILAALPLTDAIIEHLKIVGRPQTAQQIWIALERAGREASAANPPLSVTQALRKLLPKSNDLVKIGFGTWSLRSSHTKAELEDLLTKRAGRGGRTKTEHSKRTREGMKRFVAAGGKVGGKLKLTPELRDRALTLLATPGAKTRHVAKQLGISTSLLNNRGITKASARAAKGVISESGTDVEHRNVIPFAAGGSNNQELRSKVGDGMKG